MVTEPQLPDSPFHCHMIISASQIVCLTTELPEKSLQFFHLIFMTALGKEHCYSIKKIRIQSFSASK